MINKEGKLFGKISIIDIIVVLAIAVLAFGVYTRFIAPSETEIAQQYKTVEYTVEIKEVRMGTVKALKKMGDAYVSSTDVPIGKITEVTYTGAKRPQTLSDATVEVLNVPNRYTAKVKIVGKAKVHQNGAIYTDDNQAKFLGGLMYIDTKYLRTSGTILDMKIINN